METSIVLAWLVGEGLITYRIIAKDKRPPLPGELLAFSGLFGVLAIFSEFQPGLASLIAWGVDIAAFTNALPKSIITAAPAAAKGGTAGATAGATK